jgi:hypothetical protein
MLLGAMDVDVEMKGLIEARINSAFAAAASPRAAKSPKR